MLPKKYKTSALVRFFTLGIYRYGYKIDQGFLIFVGLFPKRIAINSIKKILFEKKWINGSPTYFYIIIDHKRKRHELGYSTLEGTTFQSMFKDIIEINPDIKLNDEMVQFLNKEITDFTLKFDFSVDTKDYFKRDQELSQSHPTLDAIMGLTIVFVFFPIPFVFGFVGDELLSVKYGVEYEIYRVISLVISGMALAVILTNLFISLVSMYLGHKLTLAAFIVFVSGILIGLF